MNQDDHAVATFQEAYRSLTEALKNEVREPRAMLEKTVGPRA